jgi:L-phenylalanine/L-methionine N-acetyltransferase
VSERAITIRRARIEDAAAFARIMGDADVYPGLMQLPYTSAEVWRERLAENLPAPDVRLVAERGGEVVGTCGMHAGRPIVRRRHALALGLSVASQAQGQGVGTALMQAMCDYADRWAHVTRLELTVFVDNAPAIALYRKFGFEIEGTHRAYALRDGAYVDAYAMARLHPNPPSLPANQA